MMRQGKAGLLFGWLLAVVAMVAFASAGRWQLGRMHEKQAMLDAAAQVLHHPKAQPLLLASDTKRATAYDWASGSGSLTNQTLWLDNQQMDGHVGVRMYCVMLPDIGGQAILLDAGWWPLPGDRTLPLFGCPAGDGQTVRGLLAPPPSVGLAHGGAVADKGEQRWLAARLDLPAVAAALRVTGGIAPRVLRLDPQHRKQDRGVMLAPGARDLQILPNTLSPERHLGYAVQWFGLALTVLVVAVLLTWKGRKK